MRASKHKVYAAKKLAWAMEALGEAAWAGRDTSGIVDRVRSALAAGAKPRGWDLEEAVQVDLAIARLLLEHGADPTEPVVYDARPRYGVFVTESPLVRAMKRPPDHPAREEILDLFREYAPEAVMEAYCTGAERRG